MIVEPRDREHGPRPRGPAPPPGRRRPIAWQSPALVLLLLLQAVSTGRHWYRRGCTPALAAAAPAVTTTRALPPPAGPWSTRGPTTPGHIRTVFLIVMENHNWSSIKGSASAPYINHTLLPLASYAQKYYNPPGLHPSLPNYLWLEAGTSFGIADDGDPSVHHQRTTRHLVTLLSKAGISWTAYEENIGGTTCPLTSSYPYAPKHNPFVYFDDVTTSNDPHSASCIAHERPYTELATDLQRNAVARYNFITPNLCHDMHDASAPVNDPIKQGDTWLATAVPMILHSRAYKNGGALFITWDEGEDGSDGPIGLIVLSRYARGHGYAGRVHYTHSSTLRTLQEIFGVRPLLGDAAHAADLRDLFAAFP